jgi:hypothetical protein
MNFHKPCDGAFPLARSESLVYAAFVPATAARRLETVLRQPFAPQGGPNCKGLTGAAPMPFARPLMQTIDKFA